MRTLMRPRMWWCALIVLLAAPAAAAPGTAVYYFLRMEGKAKPLERIALNGQTILSGTIASFSLPVYVRRALQNGPNELEVRYTSDPDEALTVIIEARTAGSKTEILRFQSSPGETAGAAVTKVAPFTLSLAPPAPPLVLSDSDREAIVSLVRTLHDALAQRDAAAYRALYVAALAEYAPIYPEGVAFFRGVIDDTVKMLANPQFQMQPFQPAGLQFTVNGQTVAVSRADGSPMVSSNQVDIPGDAFIRINGQETPQSGTVKVTMRPTQLTVKMDGGGWYLVPSFGF